MDLAVLSQLGEFFGAVGVVLTLIYLGIQSVFGTDSEANALFNQGVSDPTKMAMLDRTRFMWLLTELFGAMEFLIQQYHAGNIDQETWGCWAATFDWWLTWPGVQAYWVWACDTLREIVYKLRRYPNRLG
jgi:hypothetical protein